MTGENHLTSTNEKLASGTIEFYTYMNNYSINGAVWLPGSPGGTRQSPVYPLANEVAAPEPEVGFARRDRGPTRLIAAVAQLYHEERCTQKEIARKLQLSQGTVSRLLQKAEEQGIVRITVIPPEGTFVDLEELLEQKFGLAQVIVARAAGDSEENVRSVLGAAAAHFLETTLKPREVIGVTSWSATLLSMVEQMHSIWKVADCQVVQILGGPSDLSAQKHAHHLVGQLARLIQGKAHFLSGPGIVNSMAAVHVLAQDPHVRETMALFDGITVALVGIGPVELGSEPADGDNRFPAAELQALEAKGAVGNVCLHFYDVWGEEIENPLGARVFGMELIRLKSIPRVVGIAGGKRKHKAILGALRGRLVNVLITDQFSAEAILRA
jgi:DNA-binding transcriptional regulator LsrR (DeoR family)